MRLPDRLEVLSPYLFYRCLNLEELHIGSALKTVLADAFSVCDKLKKISIVAAEPPVFFAEEDDFNEFPDEIEEGSTLTVAIGAAAKYKQAPQWKRFAQIVESEKVSVDDVLDGSAEFDVFVEGHLVRINSARPSVVAVFDLLGKKVFESKLSTEVSLTLDEGSYIIKVGNSVRKIQVR